MKTKILSVIFLAVALATKAQTVPANHTDFFSSVSGYFTSFNPELEGVFDTHKGTLWIGQDWQGGAHNSSSLGLEYRFWKQVSVLSETRFEDITGNVDNQRFGLGYNVVVHDVRLVGYASANIDMREEDVSAVVGLRAEKLLTAHTFLTTGLSVELHRTETRPTFTVGTGFVF